MPELSFIRVVVSLGVPGLALGVLYLLYRNVQVKPTAIPRAWVGPLAVLFILVTGTIILFALDRYGPNPSDVYRLQVTVLDQAGRPVRDAEVWTSVGGEVKRTSGGWEIVIPEANRPEDGAVTVYASKESASLYGKVSASLGKDFVMGVEVVLKEQAASFRLGGVIWAEDGEPLPGVTVVLPEFRLQTTTDENGAYSIEVQAARQHSVNLIARKEGYETHDSDASLGNTSLNFVMRKKP